MELMKRFVQPILPFVFNSLLNGRQVPAATTSLRAHLKLNCPLDFKNAYLWNVLIYERRSRDWGRGGMILLVVLNLITHLYN